MNSTPNSSLALSKALGLNTISFKGSSFKIPHKPKSTESSQSGPNDEQSPDNNNNNSSPKDLASSKEDNKKTSTNNSNTIIKNRSLSAANVVSGPKSSSSNNQSRSNLSPKWQANYSGNKTNKLILNI